MNNTLNSLMFCSTPPAVAPFNASEDVYTLIQGSYKAYCAVNL